MKALVLAGGLGTRLKVRVPDLPKPMAPIAGRPFLEFVLDKLLAGGVEGIILSVGYGADVIRTHFGTSYHGLPIEYAVENKPLGTGGAIAYGLINQAASTTLVLNGDTLLDIDYAQLISWHQSTDQVAMVLRHVADTARYGSVLVSGEHVSSFEEKGQTGPGLINTGVYLVHPGIFKTYGLSGTFSFEADLLQKHCNRLSPRAYKTDAYFIDIGIPEDYDRAQVELPSRKDKLRL